MSSEQFGSIEGRSRFASQTGVPDRSNVFSAGKSMGRLVAHPLMPLGFITRIPDLYKASARGVRLA